MRYLSHSSTAFSGFTIALNVYKSSQLYTTIPYNQVISFSYSANAPDNGFSGMCTTSISVTVANSILSTAEVVKGDDITVSSTVFFPTFKVRDATYTKYTTTFTAYDYCGELEQEFDNTNFDVQDTNGDPKLYTQSNVLTAIQSQTGVSVTSERSNVGEQYIKDDLSGSCRDILDRMSKVCGIMFTATTGKNVVGMEYRDNAGALDVSAYSEYMQYYYDRSGKIILTDTVTGEMYTGGTLQTGNVFRLIESNLVKGTASIYTTLTPFENYLYKAFSVTTALVTTGTAAVPALVTLDSTTDNARMALNINMRATAAGFIADMSAPMLDNDKTYKYKEERDQKQVVKKGQKLGVFFLNENGSGVRYQISSGS